MPFSLLYKKVTRQTARRDVKRLLELGLIHEVEEGFEITWLREEAPIERGEAEPQKDLQELRGNISFAHGYDHKPMRQ